MIWYRAYLDKIVMDVRFHTTTSQDEVSQPYIPYNPWRRTKRQAAQHLLESLNPELWNKSAFDTDIEYKILCHEYQQYYLLVLNWLSNFEETNDNQTNQCSS